MLKSIRLTAAAATFLLASSVLVNAADVDCLSHSDLIEIDPSDLTLDMACDNIGVAYISGATGSTPNYDNQDLLEEFSYYILSRTFLNSRAFSSDYQSNTQRFSPLLIAMLDILGGGEFESLAEQQIGEGRKKLYITFVLFQFFSIEGLPREYADLFQLKIAGVMYPMKLTGNQLECFITSDIPTLPISEVFESNSFALCIDGSKSQ